MEKMDYTDPQCPFCVDAYKDAPPVHPIDVAAAVAKIDEHLNRDDYAGAERVLNYWIGEAFAGRDDRGLLSLKNEQMGLLRKLGRGDEALAASDEALALVEKIGFEGTITAATTYVNAGTVQKTFGSSALAIEYDEKALAVLLEHFEAACAQAEVDDFAMRLGSLYNNMALALADEARYDEAHAAYEAALKVMARMTHGEREQAITYLNLADLALASTAAQAETKGEAEATGAVEAETQTAASEARPAAESAAATSAVAVAPPAPAAPVISDDGSRVLAYPDSETELKILEYVGKAKELLDTDTLPRDGYHAFVLEKCAETFAFYGFNAVADEYKKIAREIYNIM